MIIGICGHSGTGKSTSLRNLPLESTIYLLPNEKTPVAKGSKPLNLDVLRGEFGKDKKGLTFKEMGNYLNRLPLKNIEYKKGDIEIKSDGSKVKLDADKKVLGLAGALDIINKLDFVKYVVIDDAKHFANNETLSRGFKERNKGSEALGRYNDLGYDVYNIITTNYLRPDITKIIITHPVQSVDTNGDTLLVPSLGSGMIDKGKNLTEYIEVSLFSAIDNEAESANDAYVLLTSGFGNITSAKTPFGMFNEKSIPNDIMLVINRINEKS